MTDEIDLALAKMEQLIAERRERDPNGISLQQSILERLKALEKRPKPSPPPVP